MFQFTNSSKTSANLFRLEKNTFRCRKLLQDFKMSRTGVRSVNSMKVTHYGTSLGEVGKKQSQGQTCT